MAQQNSFGDLFEEKKGVLDFKSKKGKEIKVTYTVAAGQDTTGLEDNLKAVAELLEDTDAQPKAEKKQSDEKKQGGQ